MFDDFHFLRPLWLLAAAPLAFLLWRLSRGDSGSDIWREVCDPHLLAYLLVGSAIQRRWWLRMVGLAWLLCVVALAGPTWSQLEQPIFKGKTARVIVLDLSLSMDATDLKPSRLTRARFKVLDILEKSREGQVALIVYAQDAFVVTPLTDDANTVAALVPVLSTKIMPRQGSRLVRALHKADEVLKHGGVNTGEIIVLTDGVSELDQALEAVRDIHSRGRRFSFLGIGTTQGAPIPLTRGGILKDADGAIVIPKLDASALRTLAQTGGGQFSRITVDDRDVSAVLAPSGGAWFGTADATQLSADQWREDGIWLVLLLLPLACFAFRRGWVLLLLLMSVGLSTQPVEAFEWQDLWSRPDQQGEKVLSAGDPTAAAMLFKDPQWRATAHYRAGNYDLALAGFATSAATDAHYNRGNTLVRLGDLRNAITAYDLALEQEPNHADALHNKAVLEKFLRQLQQDSEGNPRRRPQGESSSSSGLGPDGEGGEGNTDDETARREEESESVDQRGASELDEDYDPNLDEEFSLSELQNSRYSSASRAGQREPEDPSLQPLDDPSEGGASRDNASVADNRPTTLSDEELQALEQWLRRIPDDPGGLLRRKLLLEHRRRQLAGGYNYSATPW